MWNPVRIKIINLLTHTETEYEFQSNKAVMISGINLDNINPRSNGSGKTTIGEALSLLITGSSFRSVLTAKMVRNGEKFFEVEGEFYNSQTKDKMWIYRKIYSNTNPSLLKILFNDKLPEGVPEAKAEDCVDINEGKKFILQKLGRSEEDLFNYHLLSKDTYKAFLLSTDGTMKKVIDRFSNAQIIDPVFKEITKDVKVVDEKIAALQKEKTKSEGKIEGWEEEIEEIKERDEEEERNKLILQYEEEIQELEEEIVEIESIIKQKKDSKKGIDKKIEEAEKLVKTTSENKVNSEKKIKELEDQKITVKKELETFDEKLSKIKKLIEKKEGQKVEFNEIKSNININLADSVECPKCKHEFSIADENFDVKEGKQELVEVEKDINLLEESIQDQKKKISETKAEVEKVNVKVSKIQKDIQTEEENLRKIKRELTLNEDEVTKIKNSILSTDREIKRLEGNILSNKNSIENIKENITKERERVIEDSSDKIQLKIDTEKLAIEKFDKDIEVQQVEKQSLVEQELKFKKFKTFLANKCVASIEGYTNYYLRNFKTNLQIKMSGYRELKDGSLKEEISCNVLRDGVDEGELKKFSGGEKAEVILANIFALQSMINANCEDGGLNLTWLDEILESVDNVGMVGIYEALNSMKMCINIISHIKDTGYENELFIKKENKTSKIIDRKEYLKLVS